MKEQEPQDLFVYTEAFLILQIDGSIKIENLITMNVIKDITTSEDSPRLGFTNDKMKHYFRKSDFNGTNAKDANFITPRTIKIRIIAKVNKL